MTWLPLLGTVVGAVIALGSALLIEYRREHRQERAEHRKTKQDLYARYLAAHAHTRAQLRIIAATSGLSDEERANRARAAYAGCYAPRYEMEVLAPHAVLAPAQDFDRFARAVRDLVIEGGGSQVQDEDAQRMREYLDAMRIVRAAMRADLNADQST